MILMLCFRIFVRVEITWEKHWPFQTLFGTISLLTLFILVAKLCTSLKSEKIGNKKSTLKNELFLNYWIMRYLRWIDNLNKNLLRHSNQSKLPHKRSVLLFNVHSFEIFSVSSKILWKVDIQCLQHYFLTR